MSASPLAGTLVVDLSRYLPGPLAARLLRDLGARVIKIEEPELGDPVRMAPPLEGGRSALAGELLAGLESLALDLRRPAARKALERLLERADVLLESFRPGVLERLASSPAELRRRFPSLVVCSLSGWGQEGPHAGRSGHDLGYQAAAGALASTTAMPNLPAADLAGAWSAVASILAALLARDRGGEGVWIDASLHEAAAHANLTGRAAEAGGARAAGEPLALTGALPCYNLYRTADGGHFAVAALERRFWRRLCRAAGRPDLVPLQLRTDPASRRRVATLFRSRTREEWRSLFAAHDLPGEPVLTVAEARRHPQAEARPGSALRAARPGFPALFDGVRPRTEGGFPAVGGDTLRLVEEFGLVEGLEGGGATRRRLRADGIGPRLGWRRILWRLASASHGTAG